MKTNSYKSKSVDWKIIAQILGLLIKFLFKAIRTYKKKSQNAQDYKE